jgi:DNA-binding PadR family transcriptional regulator
MTRRRVSNPLALAVLACLVERPMHPYEMSTTLRTRGKERSIKLNYGSLYSVVEALQRHGLITAQETRREGRRPERTVYAVTEAGRAEFEDWLAELLSTPTHEPSSLEAALSLAAGLPPDEVARLLQERCVRLEMELRGVQAAVDLSREKGLPDLFLVETLFSVAMLQAELDFVRSLAADIRSGTFPGIKAGRRIHELVATGLTFDEVRADLATLLGEEEGAWLAMDAREPPPRPAAETTDGTT